jgi:hypothetical protein
MAAVRTFAAAATLALCNARNFGSLNFAAEALRRASRCA